MSIRCRVLEIDETLDGDAITIGLPDENGQQVVLTATDDDCSAVKVGGFYTLAFVPAVAPDHPAANTLDEPEAGAATPVVVPAYHPLVIEPASASETAAAQPSDVTTTPVQPQEAGGETTQTTADSGQ